MFVNDIVHTEEEKEEETKLTGECSAMDAPQYLRQPRLKTKTTSLHYNHEHETKALGFTGAYRYCFDLWSVVSKT